MKIDLGNVLTKDAKGIISLLIVFGSFYALLFGVQWLMAEATAKKPQTAKCWQIQHIDGNAYNHNACTGELKKLELPSTKTNDSSKNN